MFSVCSELLVSREDIQYGRMCCKIMGSVNLVAILKTGSKIVQLMAEETSGCSFFMCYDMKSDLKLLVIIFLVLIQMALGWYAWVLTTKSSDQRKWNMYHNTLRTAHWPAIVCAKHSSTLKICPSSEYDILSMAWMMHLLPFRYSPLKNWHCTRAPNNEINAAKVASLSLIWP